MFPKQTRQNGNFLIVRRRLIDKSDPKMAGRFTTHPWAFCILSGIRVHANGCNSHNVLETDARPCAQLRNNGIVNNVHECCSKIMNSASIETGAMNKNTHMRIGLAG